MGVAFDTVSVFSSSINSNCKYSILTGIFVFAMTMDRSNSVFGTKSDDACKNLQIKRMYRA